MNQKVEDFFGEKSGLQNINKFVIIRVILSTVLLVHNPRKYVKYQYLRSISRLFTIFERIKLLFLAYIATSLFSVLLFTVASTANYGEQRLSF